MKQHFKHYQVNKKFQENGRGYYCCRLRKRKVKNQKIFRDYSSTLARVLSTIRAGKDSAMGEMFMRIGNRPRTRHIWKYWYHTRIIFLKKLYVKVLKLRRNMRQRNFKMKNLCSKTREKLLRKKAICIKTSTLTLKKLKYPCLHHKVALLRRRRSEWGMRNQIIFRRAWVSKCLSK